MAFLRILSFAFFYFVSLLMLSRTNAKSTFATWPYCSAQVLTACL